MLPSSEIVIADTSCLILLSKIDQLDLLNVLGRQAVVTDIIANEFGHVLPHWISVAKAADVYYQLILEMELDEGEASAIALALEKPNSVLIIDDLKGRRVAERLRLDYSGTFGLILKAKQSGALKSIRPLIEKIERTDFRFSTKLIETILREAGEL